MGITIKVKLDTPCKEWKGAKDKGGYGLKTVSRKLVLAHRFAYCQANGLTLDDIDGVVIRHRCDNRACMEPTHLIAGTHRDNMQDMKARGRSLKGTKQPLAKLTDQQVLEIRSRYAQGGGESQSALAAAYGVNKSTISRILNREMWNHI